MTIARAINSTHTTNMTQPTCTHSTPSLWAVIALRLLILAITLFEVFKRGVALEDGLLLAINEAAFIYLWHNWGEVCSLVLTTRPQTAFLASQGLLLAGILSVYLRGPYAIQLLTFAAAVAALVILQVTVVSYSTDREVIASSYLWVCTQTFIVARLVVFGA